MSGSMPVVSVPNDTIGIDGKVQEPQPGTDFVRPDWPSRCTWTVNADPSSSPHLPFVRKIVPKVLPDVLHYIGNTPMIRLNKIPAACGITCNMYAKCEFFSAGGSLKDRIAVRMLEDAEKTGRVQPGCILIEPTSGNTGIGLAMAAAVKGYRCILVMPEKASYEKQDVIRALGAEVVLTPTCPSDSPEGIFAVAQRLAKEIPNSIILGQYNNPSNPLAHYDTTAEEILEQCDGKVDMVVIGAGTGGTITGVGRKIKEKCKSCLVIGVDPEGSILAQPDSMNEKSGQYEVEGMGHDFIPTALDRSVVDKWYKCNDRDSFQMARRLIREEGLLCGGSSGAVLSGALTAVQDAGLKEGETCVVLLADTVRNYMTKFLSDEWMMEREFLPTRDLSNLYFWWNTSVSQLRLEVPFTILPTVTVEEAIEIMRQKGYDQVPVVDIDGQILGVVTLGHLLSHLWAKKLDLTELVENAICRKFCKVSPNITLGKMTHILHSHRFALVVHSQIQYGGPAQPQQSREVIIGIVTQVDLLNYILSVEEKQLKINVQDVFNLAMRLP